MKDYPTRQVKIIHHKINKGLSAARKTAYQNATGKYWICCDSDDWAEPDMYERMLTVAECEDADIVCCGFIAEAESSQYIEYDYEQETRKEILDPKRFGWIYGAQWNKMIRADLFKAHHITPLESVSMWEDSCVTLPLRLYSQKTIIIKDCFYHYNVINSNSICHQMPIAKIKGMADAMLFFENFFFENGLAEEGASLISFLKQEIATPLFDNFSRDNIQLLKDIVPDVNVWNNDQWNFRTKLGHWLVLNLPIALTVRLRNIKNFLK